MTPVASGIRTPLSLNEIAVAVNGTVAGDGSIVITGVSTPEGARPGDLVFIDSSRHAAKLLSTKASAAIVPLVPVGPPTVQPPTDLPVIRVASPTLAMAAAIDLLLPQQRLVTGISSLAVIGANVSLGDEVGVGPYAVLGDAVSVGRATEIHAGSTIGAGCRVGDECVIHSGVHVYPGVTIGSRVILHCGVVIGADGFGYVPEAIEGAPSDEPLRHRKIRQVGRVVIEDDVEIGANSTIDRAALEETRIGRGTKIDNLVTIGHNCRLGRHCIVIGQAGISGSTVLGDYVTVAGQAGLTGHLTIGARAIIGAQSGVTKDVPEGGVVLGSPAVDARIAKRGHTLIDSLPEFKKRLAAIERRLEALAATR